MFRVLKAKLYPNTTQQRALTEYLGQACYVYNKCLAERRDAWKDENKSISRFDQTKHLTAWRKEDERLRKTPCEIERDAIHRVDLGFQSFFRRIKDKAKKAGYPRFKSARRYNSFSFGVGTTNFLKGGRISIPHVTQSIRCRGLQEADGTIKRITVVRRPDGWFARVLIDDGKPEPAQVPVVKSVGLDMGLNSFLTTSEGEHVECPKYYRKLARQLRRTQKRVSRRKKGSHRRCKAVRRLQLVHQRIKDCREDFTHKFSKRLAGQYDLIAAEKLNIKGMVRSKLAKSILDAGWGGFLSQLSYKMARAGKTFVQVNPAYTSQTCSQCGAIVPKMLSERVHKCLCGLVLDRDENAARNVLALGVNTPTPVGSGNARGGPVRPAAAMPPAGLKKREVLVA